MNIRGSQHVQNARIAKRRLAYSLAAGTAVVTTSGSAAEAAVVYSGLQDLSVAQGTHQAINLDGDDYQDIYLKNYVFGGTKNYQGLIVEFGPGQVASFLAGPTNFKYISALGLGALVDSSTVGPTFFGAMGYATDANAKFNNATNAYIGFSFPIGGQTADDLHYAWMRVSINNAAGTFLIRDWAYDSTPVTGIHTGDKGIPGDYNSDGVVDAADYAEWVGQFGADKSHVIGADADGNANGIVDAADYTVWRDHLGQTQSPGAAAGRSAAVPEPATLGMLAAGSGGVLLMRRLRQGRRHAD